MALVLDAGALIAVERRDRRVGALLRVAQRDAIPVRTSAAVVAQVWRDGTRQANLARVLGGVDERGLDPRSARRIGELLCEAGTSDAVDGHVALLTAAGDAVLTSDPDDLTQLLAVRGVEATVIPV